MLNIDEILFAIALACGGLLVLSAALGVVESGAHLDADGHADTHAHADTHDHAASRVLSALSFGRVPFLILVMIQTLSFGGVGMTIAGPLHAALGAIGGPLAALWGAFLGSVLITNGTSRLLARVLPRTKAYLGHKRDLVGLAGSVVSASRTGLVVARVVDRGGAEMRVNCRVNGELVQSGDEVAFVAYESESDRFLIEKTSARRAH